MKGNFVTLKKESPFYCLFKKGVVPVVNWLVPSHVKLEGSDETEAYMLDVKRCTNGQLNAIAELVAKLRGGSKEEVMKQIRSDGIPIRSSSIESVWSTVPAFL